MAGVGEECVAIPEFLKVTRRDALNQNFVERAIDRFLAEARNTSRFLGTVFVVVSLLQLSIIFLAGFGAWSFALPPSVLIALAGSMPAQVLTATISLFFSRERVIRKMIR